MQNLQDTFETLNQSFISTFSIYMTVPLSSAYKASVFSQTNPVPPYIFFSFKLLPVEWSSGFVLK